MSGTSREAVTAVVRRVLSARGPMAEDDLLGVLTVDDVDLGSDPDVMLAEVLAQDTELFIALADRRWAWLPGLLEGRIFTHRLSAMEVASDVVVLDVDLAPLTILTGSDTYQRLSDGSPITLATSLLDSDALATRAIPETVVDNEMWLLEPGRFDTLGVGAGDLIGVRVSTNGLELTKVNDTELTRCDIGSALGVLFDEQDCDHPEMADVAAWTVCASDDNVFREPAPPLGELLSASDLACDGHWVAARGFDFDAWYMTNRIETLKARYTHFALSDDDALAVLVTVRLYEQTRNVIEAVTDAHDNAGGGEHDLGEIVASVLGPAPDPKPSSDSGQGLDPDRKTVRATLEFLADPLVAIAVLAETDFVRDRGDAAALGLFSETAEPMAPRTARPALLWLRAKACERLGDIEAAEAALHTAESLDPVWPLTLTSLARYASDRGDAEHGLALLRRAGTHTDHDLIGLLQRFQPPGPRPGLGRNQRCWCGSGRKYKVCHLRREQLPLEERATWLYGKAALGLPQGPFGPLLADTVEARTQHWELSEALQHGFEDPLPADVVLFEGGAFADFLDVRGSLLPEDERLLAQQWLLAERSVHEVLSVAPSQGFTVRDVRTGDIHDVRERAGSTQVSAGQFYCLRVIPVGESMQIFGGIEPVSLGERDTLIALLDDDPDPVDLVAALSRRFAPPTLLNTEGESLMMCDATLRIGDPHALTQALDDTYERVDDNADGTLVWFEPVITDGMQRIRAHIELRDDQLHVQANSQARFERVLNTITTLDPSITVLTDTREPAADLNAVRQLATHSPTEPAQTLNSTDPAIVAALDEMIRKHEQAWPDEPIPALAGHTPRQCANDPTRRDDLIRLLDSFPEENRPGTMSPARLRAALGLT